MKSDHITDFAADLDKIDLSAIDAIALVGGRQAFTFIGTDAFTALGQLRIGLSGGHVVVQANTSGGLAEDLNIVIDNDAAFSAGDFIL